MAALARLAQFEHGTARHHLAAVLQKLVEHLPKIEQARLAIDQRHHVHAEGVLQLGLLVQIVEHHFGHFAAPQLDHQTHAVLVGLVLNVRDAFDFFLVDQIGHLLLQGLFVDLIRQFIDDDGLPVTRIGTLANVFKVHLGAHDDAATPGAVAFAHTAHAVNNAGGGKVRCLDDFNQLVDGGRRALQQQQTGIDHIGQVVRRNVGRHTDRNAGAAVDEQVRNPARQDQRLFLAAVVIGAEIDRLFVYIGQQLVADFRHADFGVTHRRRVVAVDRAEVALAINKHVAQRKMLRHAHDGVINRRVAVRVVFTDHVADDTRRFFVGAVPVVVQFVHCEQHTAMDGL